MNKLGKYIFMAGAAGALLFSVNFVFAQDTTTNESAINIEELRAKLQLQKEQLEKEIQAKKEKMKQDIEVKKLQTKENIEVKKEQVKKSVEDQKERMEKLREDAKQRAKKEKERIEEARKNAQEKAREAREKARQRIEDIRDKKKQEAAQKIAGQFERINKIWTNHFAKVLDRLDAILQKIKSRIEKNKADAKEVSLVETAILNAEAKIAAARGAVALQAQKTYVLDAASIMDSQDDLVKSFREQFKMLKEQLHKDLTALRDGAMKSARKAVQDALQAL